MWKDSSGCAKQSVAAMLGLAAFVFAMSRCMGLPMTQADYQLLTVAAELSTMTAIAAQPTTAITLPPLPPPPPPQGDSSAALPPNPCVQAPQLFDPPSGRSFSATSTILRWRSDYALKSDEVFSAWAGTAANEMIKLGTTREMTFPIDFAKWKFAGSLGTFFWDIRIERIDGARLSCANQPFSFSLSPKEEPAPVPPPPAPTRGR